MIIFTPMINSTLMKAVINGFLLLTGLVIMWLWSCVPAYLPSVVNAPLLSEQHDVVIAGYSSTSGFDPQLAYAVTEEIGLMVNGSFRTTSSKLVTDPTYYKRYYGEIGGGYYSVIGEFGRFEIFGGAGGGKVNGGFTNTIFAPHTDVFYAKGFLQPSIGFVSSVIEVAFTPRFALVTMSQDALRSTAPFFEPALTFKTGYRHWKGVMQLGLSYPFVNQPEFDYQPFMFALGIQIRLGSDFYQMLL
jgi:hypothetical protein